jgi:CBS domain-containing protein
VDDADAPLRGSVGAGPLPAVADDGTEPIGPLARAVAVVGHDTPVRDLVAAMARHDASCALVRTRDGRLGIVTDHDLRTRVLAAGRPATTTAGDVASVPAVTAPPATTTDDAVLAVLARGFRHLPVVDADGAVLGVVEDVDLLAARSRTPVRLRRAIARAATVPELVQVARGVHPAAVAAVDAGRPAAAVCGTLRALVGAVVARAVDLHASGHGPAPAPFAWLVTGSVARGDGVLASDLDSLFAWDGADDDPHLRSWMRGLAADVLATLDACGLSHDVNGVRADDPRFSRSVDAWRTAVAGWAADPSAHQGDVYLSALADARPVHGEAVWAPVADAVRSALTTPAVRAVLHRTATAAHPPAGLLRDLVTEDAGEHAGTLDLKRGGASAVGTAARYLATLLPQPGSGTVERLRAAGAHGLLADADARDLAEALGVVQGVRLKHQAAQVHSGAAPDDHLRPDELTHLERRGLRDAFKVVARVRRCLPPPPARP